jgi:hypothetical protein
MFFTFSQFLLKNGLWQIFKEKCFLIDATTIWQMLNGQMIIGQKSKMSRFTFSITAQHLHCISYKMKRQIKCSLPSLDFFSKVGLWQIFKQKCFPSNWCYDYLTNVYLPNDNWSKVKKVEVYIFNNSSTAALLPSSVSLTK